MLGRIIGMHVENSDETTLTRYFHTDHLGSISVITKETGVGAAIVVERLSYDAWGVRRNPNGEPDPSGSITSQSSRGFTGHEHLEAVGLIHMNGRVYDPLLGRYGTPDPMTESPFSTQGWNRYSYVGNSPLNFTDPSGHCFLGCFWKPIFKFLQRFWGAIVQAVLPALVCGPAAPVCAAVSAAFARRRVTINRMVQEIMVFDPRPRASGRLGPSTDVHQRGKGCHPPTPAHPPRRVRCSAATRSRRPHRE